MNHTASTLHKAPVASRSGGFWAIYALSFMAFMAIALAGQMLGWHWRTWLPGAEGVKSIFGGVDSAVYTFMSHLL